MCIADTVYCTPVVFLYEQPWVFGPGGPPGEKDAPRNWLQRENIYCIGVQQIKSKTASQRFKWLLFRQLEFESRWPFVNLKWHLRATTISSSWNLRFISLYYKKGRKSFFFFFLQRNLVLLCWDRVSTLSDRCILYLYLCLCICVFSLLDKPGWLCWDGVWSVHPARHRKIYHDQLHILAQHSILTWAIEIRN